jgi:hypothetical protein
MTIAPTPKSLAALMSCLIALTSCIHDNMYKPINPFNYREVEWATKRGTNTISGKIDGLGSDGKVYPCDRAGLAPDSAYNRELKTKVVGTTEDIIIPQKDMGFVMQYSDWEENQTIRATDCGWKGHFSFERVPDGIWYFTAMAGPRKTGYFVQRRLELRGNEKIVINVP